MGKKFFPSVFQDEDFRIYQKAVKNVPEETKRMVEKQMTCKWLRNGEECGKGLLGTPCIVKGCVAWEEYKEDEK